SDLHWLIHQGHVIEFANGTLETAKKPLPRPSKPEAKPAKVAGAGAPEVETSGAGEAAASEPAAGAQSEPSVESSPPEDAPQALEPSPVAATTPPAGEVP